MGRKLGRRLPVLLLVLAMGLAAIGVAQAYHAHRSHRATAEALVHDYGIFAARSFLQAWGGILTASLDVTLSEARNAALRQSTTEQCLTTLLAREPDRSDPGCGCKGAVPLAAEEAWAFHVTLGAGPAGRLLGGARPPASAVDPVLDSVVAYVRGRDAPLGPALRWLGPSSSPRSLYAFNAVKAFSGDTVVYGVEADPIRLRSTLEAALDDPDLLPEVLTRGRTNRELLAVRLVQAGGEEVWRSSPGLQPRLEGDQPVHEVMGGGTVRASVLPEAAGTLVIGGLPGDRVPLLLLVFGLAGGLAALAVVQLRKEEAFARERQDFVAGVSHELRTPLAQIRLFVETLRLGRTRSDDEREWALGNIDRETLRLVRLVENILHFNRAERGRLASLELEPTELAAGIREVVDGFTPLLRPREAEIVMELDGPLPAEVHGDAFQQVILNLLDNAVKYGPPGQVIRIAGRARGEVVRIRVEDQGPGVPEAERAAIWEAFRRGRDAVGSVATGSGIGLSVVREIVEAHGGRAWVEDVPSGSGARFVVELPRLRSATASQVGAAGSRVGEDASPGGARGVA